MEILYHITSITELNEIQIDDDVSIRWLKMPEDYNTFCEHLRERYPDRVFLLDDWLKWDEQGTPYCGLFKEGKMVVRAAAEKYFKDTWKLQTCEYGVQNAEKAMQNKFAILLLNSI